MKRIENYCGFFENEFERVVKALKQWPLPDAGQKEKALETSLLAFLQNEFSEVPLIRQYGIGVTTADLVIQEKFLIELKLASMTENEFKRCLGQLLTYEECWVKQRTGLVFLVIVGALKPERREAIHNLMRKMNQPGWVVLADDAFTLIEKPFLGIPEGG